MMGTNGKALAGRCALITGGASGLGLAMARAFRAAGATVAILDVDPAAEDRAAELGEAIAMCGSVGRRADVVAAFDATVAHFGRVDIAVANAGVSQNRPTLEVAEEEWDRVIDINLTGAFLTMQEAGRRMVPQGSGSIMVTSSLYGVVAAPERVGYCVSKAGVAMMAKVLAIEWAKYGVRVNAIAPGYVHTPLVEDLATRGRLDVSALERRTPIGRLVKPEEVAQVATFLASDAASAITGQVVTADGGWTAYGYI
jgi:NAD(P)-dependent dehydrogenase (short-subunit alcohol dehydrogenase family)